MTLHQLKTHPEPVADCFGCKVATISYNGCFPTRSAGAGYGDATAQKAWDKELDEYRDARSQGIQPASTKTQDIRDAVEMSNTFGDAYDATKPADFAVKHILKEDS